MTIARSEQQQMPRWYDRERWHYASDREPIRKYSEFLRLIPWKLYATFTFLRKVSDAETEAHFARFIDCLECALKANVAYVLGAEKRLSGCGRPASGRHFHAILTSAADLHESLVSALWVHMTENTDDGACVEVYNGNEDGAYYVLKLMNRTEGEWRHRKLHLFHPNVNLEKLTSRKRRSLRRHAERKEQFRRIDSHCS